MEPGRLIGHGRTAEVYTFGEGLAVKLLRPGFPRELLEEEAHKTALAISCGLPAPRVHEMIEIDGRDGLVVSLATGNSLLELVLNDLDESDSWAKTLGQVHGRILGCVAPALPDARDELAVRIERAQDLTGSQRQSILERIASLAPGEHFLHGDFHPSNVFVSDDGATVIDWSGASRGSPAADIARTLFLLSPLAIPEDFINRDQILRSLNDFRGKYLESVRALVNVEDRELEAWQLPVVTARLGEAIASERQPILRLVESLLD